jgi:hypothetical protein
MFSDVWYKNKMILKLREYWSRLWMVYFNDWYTYSFPYCNRFSCPMNNSRESLCRVKTREIIHSFDLWGCRELLVDFGMRCPMGVFKNRSPVPFEEPEEAHG